MTSIDRGDSHLQESRTWSRACRHIALFLWWAAERALADAGIDATKLARSPVRHFTRACDGKLRPEDVTDEGRAFATASYRAYTIEVEAYAKKLRVGGFDVPANKATAKYFFGWLDARLAAWRAKRPRSRSAPSTKKAPRLTARQVMRLRDVRHAPEDFSALIADPATVDAALEVLQVRTAWTRPLVPQLVELVATEFSRKRSRVLGLAMRVLANAQDKTALAALVALHGRPFLVRPYRAQWLAALASFRAPSARRVLAVYADASDPTERITATVGLVRNGSRSALGSLRRAFEDADRSVAQEAARQAHFLLKTSFAFDERQLARLVRWWDAHPDEVQRRFVALART